MADAAELRAELMQRLAPCTGEGRARRLLRRATRLTGAGSDDISADDLLRICAALSAEGGPIQRIAEDIAQSALDSGDLH